MKRFVPLITLAVLAPTLAYSGWWKAYGWEYREWGKCVRVTSDGGYVVTGGTLPTEGGLKKAWLIKTNENGDTLWSHIYTGQKSGLGFCVQMTNDGGYIMAAGNNGLIKTNEKGDTLWTRSYDTECHWVELANDGSSYIVVGTEESDYESHFWILKVDLDGNPLWSKSYGVNCWNAGSYFQRTSDGGYIFAGETMVCYSDWFQQFFWIIKTDEYGDTLWTREYGSSEVSRSYCIIEPNEGGYVIAGGEGYEVNESYYHLWFILFKIDNDGNILWEISNPLWAPAYHVLEDHEGNYIVTGMEYDNNDMLLLKINPQGDIIWVKTYETEGAEAGWHAEQTTDRGFIITGYTTSYGAGETDLFLVKTDSIGNLPINEQTPTPSPTFELLTSIGPRVLCSFSPSAKRSQISVFDASGRKVDELDIPQAGGVVTWGDGMNPGVYFIRVESNTSSSALKVVLTK